MTLDQYAVFGHPINHSKSPLIHKLFAEQTEQKLTYTARDVNSDGFFDAAEGFFKSGGKGLNCTVPLKERAWQFADKTTDRARFSKAVNTLALHNDGSILGDNTDGIGLLTDLTINHGIELHDKAILILGAGGATRGILTPLLEQSPKQLLIANRTADKAIRLAEESISAERVTACGLGDLPGMHFDLIINATSASLTDQSLPLPEDLLNPGGSCYDLAYANTATPFVRWGRRQNAVKSLDGLGMLVEQAAEAFYIWRGIRPQTGPVIAYLETRRIRD